MANDFDTAALCALQAADPSQARAFFDSSAREYKRALFARNALRRYDAQWRRFSSWCKARRVPEIPAHADSVVRYVDEMRSEGVPVDDVRMALASIQFAHALKGHPSPTIGVDVRRLVGADRCVNGIPVAPGDAARASDILYMIGGMNCSDARAIRDRAILTLGFAAALRPSEICGLRWSDIQSFDAGLYLVVHDGKGRPNHDDVVMTPRARVHNALCPLASIVAWKDALARSGFTAWHAHVFYRVGADGRLGREMTERDISDVMKARSPVSQQFNAHSLRQGWSIEASTARRDLSAIQLHLRMLSRDPASPRRWEDHPGLGLY